MQQCVDMTVFYDDTSGKRYGTMHRQIILEQSGTLVSTCSAGEYVGPEPLSTDEDKGPVAAEAPVLSPAELHDVGGGQLVNDGADGIDVLGWPQD